MKSIISKGILIRSLTLLFIAASLFGCNDSNNPNDNPETIIQDGVWEGTGEGRNGTILVRIKVENHTIVSASAISQSESSFAQSTITAIIDKVLISQNNLTQADAITGATLTSTGVIQAVNMAINAAKGIKPEDEKRYSDGECDIVVIGAGGAGLSAAIEAASKGAKVIVLEKQGIIGGNTNYSTGGLNAAETSVQKGLGIEDSKSIFYEDIMSGGHQLNDPSLVKSFVEYAPPTVDWLISLGADLSDVGLMAGSSIKRTHRPKGGTAIGSHLMKVLKEASAHNNIEIRTNNKVTALTNEGTTVVGVTVENKDKSSYNIKSKAVVIATGGFGGNLEMVSYYRPDLAKFSTLNHKGATGDAFAWVASVGGAVVQMDQIQIHPSAEYTNNILITEAVRGNGAIMVNAEAKRFVNEMVTRDVLSAAILVQTGEKAYIVFDHQVRTSLASIETYVNQGLLKTGNTIEELATSIEVPPAVLSATLTRYTTMQQAGVDEDFGRKASEMIAPLNQKPFYAVCVKPAIHHTMGGIKVNPEMQVLTADGTIIRGLYAAGEVTGGLHGGNRLGGNGVADIVVNGKIAGDQAYEYIGK
ncbi:MAG: flavocytochrome c [Phocaeicola sp.]